MIYLKPFDKLFEVITKREDLITTDKSEIKDFIEPALLTSQEYLNIVNKQNKWHDDAYDREYNYDEEPENVDNIIKTGNLVKHKTIGKINIDIYTVKEKAKRGYYENPDEAEYNKKIWIDYTDYEIKELGLPIYNYDVYAIHRDEKIVVGAGQDEWGCVLIWVFDQYRGMGIGEELVKAYREFYPSKDSGGFTSFGYNQLQKYHAYLVRKYLMNGIYSDMVRKGEITSKKVKEITDSIKDIKNFTQSSETTNPLAKYYGDTKNSIYIDDSFVVIYDMKLLQKNYVDLNSNIEKLVYDKTIKAYISVGSNDSGDFDDLMIIYAENETYFKHAMDFMLSLCKDGISDKWFRYGKQKYGIKELAWLQKYVNNGEYTKTEYEKYKDVEYYDIYKISEPINDIQRLKKITQKNLKAIDKYDEGFSIMIEKAVDVWQDYAKNNLAYYLCDKAIEKMKKYAEQDKDYFLKNMSYGRIHPIFQSWFGQYEFDNLSSVLRSKIMSKAEKEYHKLITELKQQQNDK